MSERKNDYTKDFSLLLKQSGTWELAPAYDMCHAYRPDSIWVSQHELRIHGKRQHILAQDFLFDAKLRDIW